MISKKTSALKNKCEKEKFIIIIGFKQEFMN